MARSKLFLDGLLVKNNMLPTLEMERAIAASLYDSAVCAPSQRMMTALKAEYGNKKRSICLVFQMMSSTVHLHISKATYTNLKEQSVRCERPFVT